MDAVKFVKERRRMYTLGCIKKGINDYNTKAEDVVAEVEQWSAAHPRKTRQSVFLKQYPNAVLDKDGVLRICPSFVGGDVSEKYRCLCSTDCGACRREFWMHEGGVK
jgi:hypothetical protein